MSASADATGDPKARSYGWAAWWPSRMQETNNGGSVEQVPGFRGERALAQTFISAHVPESAPRSCDARSGAPPPERAERTRFETVHGRDDRVQIQNTATIPWRCIAQLIVRTDDGREFGGTGWFAGPRTVVTAAHCLMQSTASQHFRAQQIRVIPGRDGVVAPFAFFDTPDYAVAPGWEGTDDPARDFAAVTLPDRADGQRAGWTATIADGWQLGWFGLAVGSDAKLDRLLVNNAGYPSDRVRPLDAQWFNAGRIHGVEQHFLTYLLDTYAGQSGSPIFFYDERSGERLVVGIHTSGAAANRGIRITKHVFEQIVAWIEKPPVRAPNAKAKTPKK